MFHARNFFLPSGDPSSHTLSAKKSGPLLVMGVFSDDGGSSDDGEHKRVVGGIHLQGQAITHGSLVASEPPAQPQALEKLALSTGMKGLKGDQLFLGRMPYWEGELGRETDPFASGPQPE